MKPNTTHIAKNLEQNPESVLNNQLNSSTSKMQFSFAQSQRFNQSQHISASPSKFYDLPSLWNKKTGASMGRSKRTDFSKQNVPTPSPNKYQFKSSFEKQKNQGISMGLGREAVRYRDMFGSRMKKMPEPATYHPNPLINSRAYSIAQRHNNGDNKWIKQVPGPGNYPVLQLTNSRHKKIISKYLSAHTSQFGKQQRAGLALKIISPPPNKYQIKSQSFDQSIFDKPYSTKIGSGQRRGLTDKTMPTPGPGTYKVFSQFLK